MQDSDDGGFGTELISQAKQSRSEKKARKALCKLGKSPFPRVALFLRLLGFTFYCDIL